MGHCSKCPPLFLALLVVLTGCATRVVNVPLQSDLASTGYYFRNQRHTNNTDHLLMAMAFSGGGTRAAALSCGVLEELARYTNSDDASGHRLLDEVDIISSVSGGSFTSTAYGLYGDRLFDEFDSLFLERNVQGELLWQTLNPLNWPFLWSGLVGRSDLAARYYDRILFHGATFADLARHPGPFIIVNATDISTGARFEFTQNQFDLIGSDVGQYSVARAVAASSAVPVALTPITLNNFAGQGPTNRVIAELQRATNSATASRRGAARARELASYLDSVHRPYLHLVDGGVSDNLGLRALLDAYFETASAFDADADLDLRRVNRVLVILVNAEHRPRRNWDKSPKPPGFALLGTTAATIPMGRYSYESMEVMREQLEHWQQHYRQAHPGERPALFYFVEVNISNLKNPLERQYYQNLKTSFNLPDQDVDRLRELGGRLLRQSPDFQAFLKDWRGDRPPAE